MKSVKHTKQQVAGSMFIAISALFFASYGIWSKLMTNVFGEFNQAWIRALLLLMVLIPFGILTKKFKKIKKQDYIWFLVISLSGGLNQAPYFFGFKHLPVGTATLLFYLMLTIGAYVIGKFFFKEKITLIKYFSLGLTIIGLGVIYKFTLTPKQILPAIYTAISGLLGASAVVFSKKISSNYSETQILSSIFVGMLLCNILLSSLFREITPIFNLSAPWIAQICYAITMLIANIAVVAGFKHLEPSIGGIIGLLEVIFAASFGVIFFGEKITTSLLIGGLLIIAAIGLPNFVSIVKKREN